MFDTNSEEPRKKQFWLKVLNNWPVAYTGIVSTTTSLYQFDLITSETVIASSIYSLAGTAILAGLTIAGTTALKYYRPDFDTWWNKNPQYADMRNNTMYYEEEESLLDA